MLLTGRRLPCQLIESSLTTELTDAERYQEAYYNLLDEVGVLVVRNALAEDEAQRLSKLNAEILGHTNPAQRIMYVDRIRRELAEARHVSAVCSSKSVCPQPQIYRLDDRNT